MTGRMERDSRGGDPVAGGGPRGATAGAMGLAMALALVWLLRGGLEPGALGGDGSGVDYLQDIKPLLAERCYACHGALKQKGGLRLDTVMRMRAGGDSGPAVAAGEPMASLLVQRLVAADSADRMPPEHEGERFSEEQVGQVRAWIAAGAVGPVDEEGEADPSEHWAFRPWERPGVPEVRDARWVRNPIDAFVAREHEAQGLRPVAEAPRSVLVRRLYVDLVGMPPGAAELAEVEADVGDGWYERLVDRLLDDPRHGERWARHWMDVWRYSDWWGLGDQLRNSQRHIWRWRDWIVESLNADVPYDQMLRDMLAADETHPGEPERLRATGFLARNYFLFNRNQWMDEVVEHVGKSMLGLTLNCAKCHDHKYDPITQAEYYRMRAFFEPYQVRLDVVAGEPDLERDGLPRVFDGPEVPTYRFVRGQESQPDTSKEMTPGVPGFFAVREPVIRAVTLPVEAWQPERRSWVFEAYRQAARAKLAGSVGEAGKRRAVVGRGFGGAEGGGGGAGREEALAALEVAEQDVAVARAELEALELRISATRAGWAEAGKGARGDAGGDGGVEGGSDAGPDAAMLARWAAGAEREAGVARARREVAAARERAVKAAAAGGADLENARKAMAAARERFDKAVAAAKQPLEERPAFTAVRGAAWTPTRFLDSTKDDPPVAFGPTSTGRRSALAAWITDARNPLTARVGVNHLWTRHLGVPLVGTVFDFGRKGAVPTHRGLLDWLAAEWVGSGWSMKHLHRLIVTSSVYRMGSSAAGADAQLAKDPDNRFLWRRPSIRLEAQVVRDAVLAHAGVLDLTRGGPPVAPADQAASRRRSLYFHHSNNERNLFLTTFDDAAPKECYRREASVVPQQALAMSNSALVHDAAARIAERLSGIGEGGGDRDFVARAFRVLLGYEPGVEEVEASVQAMAVWPGDGAGSGAGKAEGVGAEPVGGRVSAARTGLVWALLNHNDFVTLR